MNYSKLYIASDHAGWKLMKPLVRFIQRLGLEVEILGPKEKTPDDDYPEIAAEVARAVTKNNNSAGILLCGSGEGMAITANRFKGIRAIDAHDTEQVKLSRQHNHANIITLGGRVLTKDKAEKLLSVFLKTEYSDAERHIRRVNKIDQIV